MTDAPHRLVRHANGRFAPGDPGRRPLGVLEEDRRLADRTEVSLVVETTPVGDADHRSHRINGDLR